MPSVCSSYLYCILVMLMVVSGCKDTRRESKASKSNTSSSQNISTTSSKSAVAKSSVTSVGDHEVSGADAAAATQALGGKNGWPIFRGDVRRTGQANVSGPRKADALWAFRTGGIVYADVAINRAGDTVYIASHDGFLYAVGPDGREIWSFDAGGKIWTSPAVGLNGRIFFGTDSDKLIALESDGRVAWQLVTAPGESAGKSERTKYDVDTSVNFLDDGTLIFACHSSVYAVRPGTGELRWKYTAENDNAKIFSSPAVRKDGTIFIGTQGRRFLALNSSGKLVWERTTEKDNDSTPVVAVDGHVYFASDDGRLRAISAANKLDWELDLGAPVRAPLALASEGYIYAATYGLEPFVASIDLTGKELWRFHIASGEGDFYGIQSGVTVDAEGYLYFGGRDHFVYCLKPNGKLQWKYRTGGQVDASPVLGPDGTLYIGSDDGRVYAFARTISK